jgi:hypothetical protein
VNEHITPRESQRLLARIGGGRVGTCVNGVRRVVPLTHDHYPYQIRTYPLQATKGTATS